MEADPNELLPCAHSLSLLDGIGENFAIHTAPRQELASHGGVCEKCFQAFSKRNGGAIKGRPQRPAEIQPHHRHDVVQDHIGFDENHELLGVADFDYAAVDRLAGEINDEPLSVREMVADLLCRILVVCWSGPGDKPTRPQVALQRFGILCSAIRPDITKLNFSEVAHAIGISKQASSKQATRIQHVLGIKFSATRSEDTRRRMRATRLKNPVGRNVRATPAKDSFRPGIPQGSDRTP